MGFQDAVRSFFKRYADFQGRSSRSEYWYFYLAYILATIAAVIVIGILAAISDILGFIGYGALMLAGLAILVPTLAISFRRIHDIDKSAWWLLLSLVPLLGLVILVFFIMPGTKGPNRFGPDPLADETTAEVFA